MPQPPSAPRPTGPRAPRAAWSRRSPRTRLSLGSVPIEEAPAPSVVKRRERIERRTLAAADALAAVAAFVLVITIGADAGLRPAGVVAMILALILVNKVGGLYDRDAMVLNRSTLDEVPKLVQISGLFALATWLVHRFVTTAVLTQGDVVGLWAAAFAAFVAGRLLARAVSDRLAPTERCLVIGDPVTAERIRLKMRDSHVNAEVVGGIAMPEEEHAGSVHDSDSFHALVREYRLHRIIVAPAGSVSGPMLETIRMAKAAGLSVSLLPRLFEVIGSSVEFDELDGLTMLGIRRFGLSRSSRAVKRALDLVGATFGLLLAGLLMAAMAIAIRLDSRGPVFFRQVRVGRDGERFRIFKFRTMVTDAEALKHDLRHRNEGADGFFKIADDPRITRVGRLLRRTSLDELPQLFNVLRGEMSLVGPRPLIEEEDELILGSDRSRLHLTPGMTGHWQVLGSARIPMEEMMSIDYLYVANWTLWADIKILFRTAAHVFSRRGI